MTAARSAIRAKYPAGKQFRRLFSRIALLLAVACSFSLVRGVGASETCPSQPRNKARIFDIGVHGDIRLENGITLKLADLHFHGKQQRAALPVSLHRDLRSRLNGKVITYLIKGREDRYQRLPADIWLEDEVSGLTWLQESLVRDGKATYMPAKRNRRAAELRSNCGGISSTIRIPL
ncbi:MAG: hypothetical protein AAGE89_10695, partial [Pseudomonadota bacterium]